jgi:hypothetical protein
MLSILSKPYPCLSPLSCDGPWSFPSLFTYLMKDNQSMDDITMKTGLDMIKTTAKAWKYLRPYLCESSLTLSKKPSFSLRRWQPREVALHTISQTAFKKHQRQLEKLLPGCAITHPYDEVRPPTSTYPNSNHPSLPLTSSSSIISAFLFVALHLLLLRLSAVMPSDQLSSLRTCPRIHWVRETSTIALALDLISPNCNARLRQRIILALCEGVGV